MSLEPFHRDNHFVPQLYLRHFAGSDGSISVYRTLVPRPEILHWKARSIKGVAYLSHLYTRFVAGGETDEEERWLEREIETPAAEPIQRVASGDRLTREDWHNLIRFLAAQIVRTPAYFVRNLPVWRAQAPGVLDSVHQDVMRELEEARKSGIAPVLPESPHSGRVPLAVTTETTPGQDTAEVRVTVAVGRAFWLWWIRHALTDTERVLHNHKWTILKPAAGMTWFTSDDPVICLNYYGQDKYDCGGGWGRPGCEILLPISPGHLLYTRIGHAPPRRGEVVSPERTDALRRIIAAHAYRMIFAASPDAHVSMLRPRIVDKDLFNRDKELWLTWHQEQTAAEREVMGRAQA